MWHAAMCRRVLLAARGKAARCVQLSGACADGLPQGLLMGFFPSHSLCAYARTAVAACFVLLLRLPGATFPAWRVQVRVRNLDGTFELDHVDVLIDKMLHSDLMFDIALPRIPHRCLCHFCGQFGRVANLMVNCRSWMRTGVLADASRLLRNGLHTLHSTVQLHTADTRWSA